MKFNLILLIVVCMSFCLISCEEKDNSDEVTTEITTSIETAITAKANTDTIIPVTSITTSESSTNIETTVQTETTVQQDKISNTKTLVASTMSIEIPNSWKLTTPSSYANGLNITRLIVMANGNFRFILEECDVYENLTDEEIFNTRINQLWEEETCVDVSVGEMNNITYSYSSYSDDPNFHIYAFAHNGYLYQFDVTNLNMFPNGEEIITNIFNSITFDVDEINLGVPQFDELSKDNQDYLVKSALMFYSDFSYPNSININKCCKYIEDNCEMLLYELTFTNSSNQQVTNSLLYNLNVKGSVILDQTYEDAQNNILCDIYEYDAESINNVWQAYVSQLE